MGYTYTKKIHCLSEILINRCPVFYLLNLTTLSEEHRESWPWAEQVQTLLWSELNPESCCLNELRVYWLLKYTWYQEGKVNFAVTYRYWWTTKKKKKIKYNIVCKSNIFTHSGGMPPFIINVSFICAKLILFLVLLESRKLISMFGLLGFGNLFTVAEKLGGMPFHAGIISVFIFYFLKLSFNQLCVSNYTRSFIMMRNALPL